MTYFKIFAISVFSSLLFLSIFVMVAFDSENTLSKAYDHFAKEEYYEARNLLINEENPIPLADFYLYEAYLAREELGLRKSQGYLLQAFEELKRKKSSTALEIALNLALDAYLQKDIQDLQSALEKSIQYAAPEEPWVHFFTGCQAYMNNDYATALKSWDESKTRQWLSNWMKTSFELHLSYAELELTRLHSEIETGQIWTTRKKLEEILLTFPEENHDDIRFLLALSYLKECDKLAYDKCGYAYQNALELLQHVSLNNSYYQRQKQHVHNAFKAYLVEKISHHDFSGLPSFITALEQWNAREQLESITDDLAQRFYASVMTNNDDEASVLMQGLSYAVSEGNFKNLLSVKLTKQMYNCIARGHLTHLEKYWNLSQNFLSSQNQSVVVDGAASKILELVERASDLKEIQAYVQLWSFLEKMPQNRYALAQQLVNKSQHLWAVKGEFLKAISLMKIAELLPFEAEQIVLHDDIERAIVKCYHQAVLQDHVNEFPFIQSAINQFHLSSTEILDKREMASQLADAQYLLSVGQNELAAAKVKWVLQVNPSDQTARKIAVWTAYEAGQYHEALQHIQHLTTLDDSFSELLIVSKSLTGDQGIQELLKSLSERNLLSNETKLRMAYGYLILSQPDQSLVWLNQIQPVNDEVMLGFCIAAFQKQEWDKAIQSYNQLEPAFKQMPALQCIAIQALIAQNQKQQADELFANFSYANATNYLAEGSKPFHYLQKHLNYFDSNDFAARYYLHVNKNPEKALEKFHQLKVETPELLYERAELALSLNYNAQAIPDLKTSIDKAKGAIQQKSLALLGNIYLKLGLYADSVHYFNELYSLNPQQSQTINEAYCQALMAIGRYDIASRYFNLLEIVQATFYPIPSAYLISPIDTSPKNLKAVQSGSISLRISMIKEYIKNSETSKNSTEDLLIAYQILEDLHKEYSYIPETWFLQGKVLTKLNFSGSAKKAYEMALSLNPRYISALKQLAMLNLIDGDLQAAVYNLKQCLEISPDDSEAWISLAQIQEKQHLLAFALEAWTKAAQLNPQVASYFIKIAKLNLSIQKPQEAIAAIEHALTLSPSDNACWKILQQALQHPNNAKISLK